MRKRRDFLKTFAALSGFSFIPSFAWPFPKKRHLKTAHIGIGGMGFEDLKAVSSHGEVEVVALCDVDSAALEKAKELFPKAEAYKDYRRMLSSNSNKIDAVIVSTPDHTHAPASIMAMKMDKHVYCQKPLSHYVSESRIMSKLAEEKSLTISFLFCFFSILEILSFSLLFQIPVLLSNEQPILKISEKKTIKNLIFLTIINHS
mgnify:CR=1 FL=1